MTAKLKRVLADLASLSPTELEELAKEVRAGNEPELLAFMERLGRLAPLNTNELVGQERPPFSTVDLARLLKDLPPDPAFADDIEAGVRARREADASRTSPWDS